MRWASYWKKPSPMAALFLPDLRALAVVAPRSPDSSAWDVRDVPGAHRSTGERLPTPRVGCVYDLDAYSPLAGRTAEGEMASLAGVLRSSPGNFSQTAQRSRRSPNPPPLARRVRLPTAALVTVRRRSRRLAPSGASKVSNSDADRALRISPSLEMWGFGMSRTFSVFRAAVAVTRTGKFALFRRG